MPPNGGIPAILPEDHFCFRKFVADSGQLLAYFETAKLKDGAGPAEQSQPGGEAFHAVIFGSHGMGAAEYKAAFAPPFKKRKRHSQLFTWMPCMVLLCHMFLML